MATLADCFNDAQHARNCSPRELCDAIERADICEDLATELLAQVEYGLAWDEFGADRAEILHTLKSEERERAEAS